MTTPTPDTAREPSTARDAVARVYLKHKGYAFTGSRMEDSNNPRVRGALLFADAVLALPCLAAREAHGWLFHNPDTGTEWSENHPIDSGECDDATDIREATAAALLAELLLAWHALNEWRAARETATVPQESDSLTRRCSYCGERAFSSAPTCSIPACPEARLTVPPDVEALAGRLENIANISPSRDGVTYNNAMLEAAQALRALAADANHQCRERVKEWERAEKAEADLAQLTDEVERALKWVREVYPGRTPHGGAVVHMTWDEFNAVRALIGLSPAKRVGEDDTTKASLRVRALAAEAQAEAMRTALGTLLDERQKRAELLHDYIVEVRETLRKRLSPDSSAEDRATYKKLNAALYILRGDPFDMHARAALAHLKAEVERLRNALTMPDAQRRLWFISDTLARQGRLNRADICQAFGVSVPQASADIREWMKLHPGALAYDRSGKRYVPALRAALSSHPEEASR